VAAGSQTVPNSVAEIAAAQGQSLPANPPAVAALPAPQRKKLPLKKAKRADELDEENRGLKTKIDELQLDAVQVLISSFGAVFL